LESFHFDIEEEFLRGLEDLEKEKEMDSVEIGSTNTENREKQKSEWIQKKKDGKVKIDEDKKIKSYFVRIPILNPYYKNSMGSHNLKYAFYFRSLKPHSYWMKRNTMIILE